MFCKKLTPTEEMEPGPEISLKFDPNQAWTFIGPAQVLIIRQLLVLYLAYRLVIYDAITTENYPEDSKRRRYLSSELPDKARLCRDKEIFEEI